MQTGLKPETVSGNTMTDELDLYLTSSDWLTFNASKLLTKIERVRMGLFTYYLVTTKETIKIDNVERNDFLLTKLYRYVSKNFENELQKSFDVYIAERNKDGKLEFGKLIARDTILHKRDQ